MLAVLLLFVAVFALNILPAFAPPTWMALSYISYHFPANNTVVLALVGAAAATLGRITLAKLSRSIIRQKILSDESRQNLDSLKAALERRHKLTSGLYLFYALSPLPSNYLFLAYGLTSLSLTSIAWPFFLGRFVGYNLWAFAGSAAAKRLTHEAPEHQSYLSFYFVAVQLLSLAFVYLFTRVDWQALLREHKLCLMKNAGDFHGVPHD